MIMQLLVNIEMRLDTEMATKDALEDLRAYVDASAQETRRHFDFMVETLRHNLIHGALNDKVEQHEDRIRALERRTGVR